MIIQQKCNLDIGNVNLKRTNDQNNKKGNHLENMPCL